MDSAPLTLGPGTVGALEFVLTTANGDELERVEEASPLVFLFGAGVLLPALERALQGRAAGEAFAVRLAPEEAFGPYDPSRVHYVPVSQFPDGRAPEVGTQLAAQGPDGQPVEFWVTAVEEERVVVNENHPLAGETLSFQGKLVGVRAATDEERSTGKLAEG